MLIVFLYPVCVDIFVIGYHTPVSEVSEGCILVDLQNLPFLMFWWLQNSNKFEQLIVKIRWRQLSGHFNNIVGRPITGRPFEFVENIMGFP